MGQIISYTLREAVRRKTLLVIVILAVVYLILFGTGLYFISDNLKIYKSPTPDMVLQHYILLNFFFSFGLFFASLAVNVIAVFSAVGAISGELEAWLLQPLLVRPVKKWEVFLGKFIGYGLLGIIAAIILILALVAEFYVITGFIPQNVWFAGLILSGMPLILTAVTLTGSVRLSPAANGFFAFTLYMASLVGGMMEQVASFFPGQTKILQEIGLLTSIILPTDAIYRKGVSYIFSGVSNFAGPLTLFGSANPPSLYFLGYTLLYLMGVVILGIYLFNKREAA
ncbi:ABC transporter permease subunit [Carboxydothermus ferrireducens]|uniref:ABC-type transport system involved in multi-copper enzyme maturation permease subunit n=1 Tax=Carboxydothermus ferrireducens DSM 11255 TaxID=1119529 RepID=A0ABX2RAA2_9THEO|nr:ABC transporter permease subunit [Carboxydothermus ferrireducens]NYE57845.1 ABC-type transport system involved in multi-copper enzyme maturation permease subunit [Carboxydothermus ferrireducens DSM 11255]